MSRSYSDLRFTAMPSLGWRAITEATKGEKECHERRFRMVVAAVAMFAASGSAGAQSPFPSKPCVFLYRMPPVAE